MEYRTRYWTISVRGACYTLDYDAELNVSSVIATAGAEQFMELHAPTLGIHTEVGHTEPITVSAFMHKRVDGTGENRFSGLIGRWTFTTKARRAIIHRVEGATVMEYGAEGVE
jgi:hypothetical protein